MVRWVVVVVCSSSNSNNGEKVDICSSKNELSSKKKNFFLIFCPDLFCSFFYLFWRCSHLLLLFFENGFFQTDDWAQFCLVCFYLVILSKAGQNRPYILVVLGKMGFCFQERMRVANTETQGCRTFLSFF